MIKKHMDDGETERCPAVGLDRQCSRPYERHGHQVGPHEPPDACYFGEPVRMDDVHEGNAVAPGD